MNKRLRSVWDSIAGMTVIFHKAPHDLIILAELFECSLEQLLDHIGGFEDSMTAAYVLRTVPKGLKPLARRFAGIAGESYLEVVAEADERIARTYLERLLSPEFACRSCDGVGFEVVEPVGKNGKQLQPRTVKCPSCDGDGTSWPPPDERIEYKNGTARVASGWRLGRRVRRTLKEKPEKGWRDWWESLDELFRLRVEAVVGPMPPVTLSDVEPQSRAINYSACDADRTIRVWPVVRDMLEAEDQTGIYEINRDSLPLITRMMDVGIKVDVPYLRDISMRLENDCDKIAYKLEQSIGYFINPNSSDQVADLLFDRYRLPVIEYTDTDKESTKDAVLEDLKLQVAAWPTSAKQKKYVHELTLITDYRERTKLRSMTENLIIHTDSGGRIHCTFNEAVTDTNRFSSSDPNLQNIPYRTELGRLLRAAFVAPDGYELVDADYSQIEVRVIAHVSGDENLLRIIRSGEDVHLGTAVLIFEKSAGDIAKQERHIAKRITFLILYGGGAGKLKATLNLEGVDVTEDQSQGFIDAYLQKAYPGIQEYMWEMHAHARRYGYVEDMWGWRKYLPGVHSEITSVRREAERMATNAPIQSGAAGITRRACPRIYDAIRRVRRKGYDCDPLLTVHDEFLLQVKRGGGELLKNELAAAMIDAATLDVPIVVDGGIGLNWRDAH